MAARLPKWPPTTSQLLNDLQDAMRARSKSLRHNLTQWDCERLTDEANGRTSESLLVIFRTYGAEFRLRLWDDGGFWFSARDMHARRVVFELSFNGDLQQAGVSELVEAVEASFIPGNIRESAEDAQEQLLHIFGSLAGRAQAHDPFFRVLERNRSQGASG